MTAFARTQLFATGVLLAVLVIGCGGSAASPSASGTESPGNNPPPSEALFPRTLIDDVGDSVTISAEPQKIVALTPASLETLAALGLADRVVAAAECSCTPDALKSIPTVANYSGVDVEAIVALEPDLVFVAAPPFTPEDAISALRAANLTIVTLNPTSIIGVMQTIQLIGDAVGATLPAADLVASIEGEITALVSLVDVSVSPSVFYEIDATSAIYGLAPDAHDNFGLRLGALAPRGESGVLVMSLDSLLRVTSNPFFPYLRERVAGIIPGASGTPGATTGRAADPVARPAR